MTREQKAQAAFGSVLVVAVFLLFAWSVWLGVGVLVVGLGVTVAVLRQTHPRGGARPPIVSLFSPSEVVAPRELSEAERLAQLAELERRRAEALDRASARQVEVERRRAEQEARSLREREREAREREAREREAREREAREAREREAREREAREREAREREAREREARELRERELREREAREREAREREAREAREREAREREAREAREREAREREAREREARELEARKEREAFEELARAHPTVAEPLDDGRAGAEDVVLEASKMAEISADPPGDVDRSEEDQRVYLLNKVRLRLSDYE